MAKKDKSSDVLFNLPVFDPEKRSKIEEFYKKNRKIINNTFYVIAIIALGFFVYKNYYLKNKEKDAEPLMFQAEKFFKNDSIELALYGSEGETFEESSYGFLDIIDEYPRTKTGNLAKYYAGLCFMKLGNKENNPDHFEDAIDYLKKFKTDSEILKPLSVGAIGDCYSELEEYEQAAKYYVDAANAKKNKFTRPFFLMKAGVVFEELEEFENAIDVYEKLKKEFPKTQYGMNVDKYLGRAKARLSTLE